MFVSILPEWACFILTLIFVLFSHEVGYRLGFKKSLKPGENPAEAAGALSGTATVMLVIAEEIGEDKAMFTPPKEGPRK